MKDTHQTDPEKVLNALKELQDKNCIATFKIEYLMNKLKLDRCPIYQAKTQT